MVDAFPIYPDFREIRVNDKEILEAVFKKCEPNISEYTFTNLFVWRGSNVTLVSQIENVTLIKRFNTSMNQFHLLPPISPPSTDIVDLVYTLIANKGEDTLSPIYGLNPTQAQSLEKAGFTSSELRDDWDYIYYVQDLIELTGEKYNTKRKNINKCRAEYALEYTPINPDTIGHCLRMQTSWCNLRNCDAIPGLEAENRAIKETFLHFDELNLFGGAVYVDGSLEAFTIGERLNSNTAVIHFEKANPNITGLYQVINQWFCSEALSDFSYVNREQDLGIPGLRRAKMSYHPVCFVQKYLVSL